jgi:hypothetical protein
LFARQGWEILDEKKSHYSLFSQLINILGTWLPDCHMLSWQYPVAWFLCYPSFFLQPILLHCPQSYLSQNHRHVCSSSVLLTQESLNFFPESPLTTHTLAYFYRSRTRGHWLFWGISSGIVSFKWDSLPLRISLWLNKCLWFNFLRGTWG